MGEGRAMQEQLPTSPGMGEGRASKAGPLEGMQERMPTDAAAAQTGTQSVPYGYAACPD